MMPGDAQLATEVHGKTRKVRSFFRVIPWRFLVCSGRSLQVRIPCPFLSSWILNAYSKMMNARLIA
jgi:hypothetical protein